MSENRAAARPVTASSRLCDVLRAADRRAEKYDRTRRLRDVIGEHRPWWDWGHRLMALVGRDDAGNWGPPRVRDLYFRPVYEIGDPETGKPGRSSMRTTRDGWEAWQEKDGEWRCFDSQDDGSTIRVGYLGTDGRLHDSGINGREEIALFRRWLMWDGWVKAEWFGLRPWLYYKGLHHAVDHRVPFTCGLVPPRGSGGYSHWHCEVHRRVRDILAGNRQQHAGPHRFGNYRWDGAAARVDYDPQCVAR